MELLAAIVTTTIAPTTTTTLARVISAAIVTTTTTSGGGGSGAATGRPVAVVLGFVLGLIAVAVTVRPIDHPRVRSISAALCWSGAGWLFAFVFLGVGVSFWSVGLVVTAATIAIFWKVDFRPRVSAASAPPPPPSSDLPQNQAEKPPIQLSLVETIELGKAIIETSQAIYAFLNKYATRRNEAKVVAEYRLKFDAQVVNLCLDLIAGGLAKAENMQNTMTPPNSVEDIQWIARFLSVHGKGYSALTLETDGPSRASFIKSGGTNSSRFSRIESAADSLGHTAERDPRGLVAITGEVLRPGQQVIFSLDVTDPDCNDIALNVVTPALREADVIIDDSTVAWNVIDKDIADPAYVSFFVTSKRSNHRFHTHDDAVTFAYSVVPA